MLKQRLLAGGAWTFGGRIVAALSGFFVNALLARLLSPGELGTYFLLVSVVYVGAMVAQLGLQVAVVRLISEALANGLPGRARGVARKAFTIVVPIAMGFGLLLAIIIHGGAPTFFGSPILTKVASYIGVWMSCLAIVGLIGETLRGFHDYRAAGMLGGGIFNVVLIGVLLTAIVALPRIDLSIVILLVTIAIFACVVLSASVLRTRTKGLGQPTEVGSREVLSVSLPLLVSSLAIFLAGQADLWILGAFCAKEEVAVYGAAARLVQLVMMPMLIMNAVLAPLISELHSQDQRAKLGRMLRACAVLTGIPAVSILALLFAAASPILAWTYGEFYRSGDVVLILLSLGQVLNVLSGSAAIVLMMTGHQRAVMMISVISGATLVLGGFIAVGPFGITGVAAVAAFSAAMHGLLSLVWVHRTTGMWIRFGFADIREVGKEAVKFISRTRSEAKA